MRKCLWVQVILVFDLFFFFIFKAMNKFINVFLVKNRLKMSFLTKKPKPHFSSDHILQKKTMCRLLSSSTTRCILSSTTRCMLSSTMSHGLSS